MIKSHFWLIDETEVPWLFDPILKCTVFLRVIKNLNSALHFPKHQAVKDRSYLTVIPILRHKNLKAIKTFIKRRKPGVCFFLLLFLNVLVFCKGFLVGEFHLFKDYTHTHTLKAKCQANFHVQNDLKWGAMKRI